MSSSSKKPSAPSLSAVIQKNIAGRLSGLQVVRDPQRQLSLGAELITGLLEGIGTLEAALLEIRGILGLTARPGDVPIRRTGQAMLGSAPSRRRKK